MVGTPFKKGQSGNPTGRPKIPEDVRDMARALTPEAMDTLATVMRDVSQPAAARVSAADKILDRAYGKPAQHITTERVESLSDAELADEFAAAIAALRSLGIDPSGIVAGSGDQAPSGKRGGSKVTH